MKLFEELILKLSTKFVNLEIEDFKDAIEEGLGDLGAFLNIDRAFIFLISKNNKFISNEFEWCAKGIKSLKEKEQDLPLDFHDWVMRKISNFKSVEVEKTSDLPIEAGSFRETLENEGVKSTLILPLSLENEVIGLIGFDSIKSERSWPSSYLRLLSLMANIVSNALSAYRLRISNIALKNNEQSVENDGIITKSDKLRKVLSKLYQVSPTNATVLILGESGTGKELLAKAVHRSSNRSTEPLVKVNCGALPANLIESELFGHEKGAFTGAVSSRIGRFELANKGTLFLDEVGELPHEVQTKLLRVIQEGEFERLGSTKTIKVDVRIVAATHRDLEKMIQEGDFREDLFYRLNVFPINNLPLRERKEDIALLAEFFTKKFVKEFGKNNLKISGSNVDKLCAYHWPGNVRELQNIIERAVIISQGNYLNLNDWAPKTGKKKTQLLPFDEHITDYLKEVLISTNWKISGKGSASEVLQLNPKTLESKIRKLGINRSNSY